MGETDLRTEAAAWLAALDAMEDARSHGLPGAGFGPLGDGLDDLARKAAAVPPGPVGDAVLALASAYDDLRVVAAAGIDVSPDTRRALAERVAARVEAMARLVSGDLSGS